MTARKTLRTRRPIELAAVPFVAALLGAGCAGSSSSGAELPSLDSAAATESDAAVTGQPSEAEIGRVLEEYRACMVEALPPGSDVDVSLGPDGPSINVTTEGAGDFDEDDAAHCEAMLDELEQSFIGDADTVAARKEQSEAIIKCLVDRGYVKEDGFAMTVDRDTGFLSIDVDADGNADEFELAEQECAAEAGDPI